VANLVRHVQSGNYYARIRVRGKLIWKTLKTDRISVAKLRLGDFHKEERHRAEAHPGRCVRGKMTFRRCPANLPRAAKGDQSLKPSAASLPGGTHQGLAQIAGPSLKQTDVRPESPKRLPRMGGRGSGELASPSAFNNTVGTLRLVIWIAVEAGARYDNPADEIKESEGPAEGSHLARAQSVPLLVEKVRKPAAAWAEAAAI
jgi:hypothetical protein